MGYIVLPCTVATHIWNISQCNLDDSFTPICSDIFIYLPLQFSFFFIDILLASRSLYNHMAVIDYLEVRVYLFIWEVFHYIAQASLEPTV